MINVVEIEMELWEMWRKKKGLSQDIRGKVDQLRKNVGMQLKKIKNSKEFQQLILEREKRQQEEV